MTSKAEARKLKLYKFDFLKIKYSCSLNDTFKQMATDDRNIANHIYDESLSSKIYEELLQLNNKKANKSI